ncbi:ABC transporter permease [Herbiconiux sp.]|uniref:ABC transporter permease n=1 Tax=Herbiconiux sp. TaxID=1871186 RepID=UPI0025BDDF39|nr:ABC transporter permease [Herbiconiux sp.]
MTGTVAPIPRATAAQAARRGLRRAATTLDPLATVAACVLLAMFAATILARLVGLGGSPTEIVGTRLAAPSLAFPLGTDSLGRSLVPRLLEGIGTTLLLSVIAVAITAVLASTAGIVAGYRGGRVNGTIMRVGDMLYAFPSIILAILVAAVVGPGQVAALASIVLVTVPLMTRLVAVSSRAVADRDFVAAAVISGVSTPRILVRHILRNVAGTIAVQGTYALSIAILVEGGLSFLGYGVQLPGSSLGLLIKEGTTYMVKAPWLIVAPGVVLVIAILCINVIGDSLRDRLEPRETRSLV